MGWNDPGRRERLLPLACLGYILMPFQRLLLKTEASCRWTSRKRPISRFMPRFSTGHTFAGMTQLYLSLHNH